MKYVHLELIALIGISKWSWDQKKCNEVGLFKGWFVSWMHFVYLPEEFGDCNESEAQDGELDVSTSVAQIGVAQAVG